MALLRRAAAALLSRSRRLAAVRLPPVAAHRVRRQEQTRAVVNRKAFHSAIRRPRGFPFLLARHRQRPSAAALDDGSRQREPNYRNAESGAKLSWKRFPGMQRMQGRRKLIESLLFGSLFGEEIGRRQKQKQTMLELHQFIPFIRLSGAFNPSNVRHVCYSLRRSAESPGETSHDYILMTLNPRQIQMEFFRTSFSFLQFSC